MRYRVRFSERRANGATRTLVEKDVDGDSILEAITWAEKVLQKTEPNLLAQVESVRAVKLVEATEPAATAG